MALGLWGHRQEQLLPEYAKSPIWQQEHQKITFPEAMADTTVRKVVFLIFEQGIDCL